MKFATVFVLLSSIGLAQSMMCSNLRHMKRSIWSEMEALLEERCGSDYKCRKIGMIHESLVLNPTGRLIDKWCSDELFEEDVISTCEDLSAILSDKLIYDLVRSLKDRQIVHALEKIVHHHIKHVADHIRCESEA